MKKITYLVASLLLMGTTPLLTGCVDIDEPAGIEELRGAKAELLTAKAAVEKAKVATEEANAAYINAEAEYVKAQAAREKAEATIAEAQAELIKAQTESEKLEAEMKKAQAEQELAEAKASAEQAAKEWELTYKKAEAEYQALLVNLAVQKSTAIDNALTSYKGDVKHAKAEMESRAEDLRDAQRELDKALSALEAQAEVDKPVLENKVALAESKVAAQEEALKEAQATYAEAQGLKVADLATKYAEIQEKKNAADRKLADAQVKAAEEKQTLDQTYEPAYKKLADEAAAAEDKVVEVPAFSFTTKGVLVGGVSGTASSQKATASYSDMASIDNRLDALNDLLDDLNLSVRSDNDDANDAEIIAEKTEEQKEIVAKYNKYYELWSNAVAAYKADPDKKYGTTSPEKIEKEYNALKKDVEALNATITAYNAVQAKIDQTEKDKETADKAGKAAVKAAEDAYTAAVSDAKKAKTATENGAAATAKTQKAAYEKAQTNAQTAYDNAQTALSNYIMSPSFDSSSTAYATLQANAANALIALNAAKANNAKAEAEIQSEIVDAAGKTYDKAILDANTTKTNAYKAANEAYEEALKKINETVIAETKNLDETMKKVDAAQKTITDSKKGSYTAFINKVKDGTVSISTPGYDVVNAASTLNAKKLLIAVEIEKVVALNHDELEAAIKAYAKATFGTVFDDATTGTPRLTAVTEDQMNAYVKKQIVAYETGDDEDGNIKASLIDMDDYADLLDEFGLLGDVKYINEYIAYRKALQTNDSDVATMIKTIEAEIASTEALKASIKKTVDDAWAAYDAKFAEYNERVAETQVAVTEAEYENVAMTELLDAYEGAITSYKGSYAGTATEYTFDEDNLKEYVRVCKGKVEDAETNLVSAQSSLTKAKQALAKLTQSGDEKAAYELAQQDLEDAQDAYKAAQEEYNVALEALNAKMTELNVQ